MAPLLFSFLVTIAGCGRKPGIGAVSGDGGADEDGRVNPPPTAVCPDEQYGSPARPAVLRGGGEDDRGISAWRWEVISAPDGSTAEPDPPDEQIALFAPDIPGDHVLRLTVWDTENASSTCETKVHGLFGEPQVICPEVSFTQVNHSVALHGEAHDDGEIVWVEWSIVAAPQGSTATIQGAHSHDSVFVPDVPGVYVVQFTVRDDEGFESSCQTEINVGQVPTAVCPEDMWVGTRTDVTLHGDGEDDGVIDSWSWEVLSHDTDTDPVLENAASRDALFWALRVGDYQMRLTVTDNHGLSDSCDFTIHTTPTGPTALCPGDIDTVPLDTVDLVADGEDDGQIVGYLWELVSGPPGSSASPPSPAQSAVATFTPDIVGQYQIRLTVTDDDGNSDSCELWVNADPGGGLRVELFWNPPESPSDSSDVDLHLIHPTAPSWFHYELDCYYHNCNSAYGEVLDWDVYSYTPDNPRLDLDDTHGYGPENINIDEPITGHTYTVGIHYFSGNGMGPADAYVKIYCGNIDVDPVFELGPKTLTEGSTNSQNDFWKVAQITWQGFTCDISPIDVIVTRDQAATSP
jgi:hypothetical protein